MAKFTENCTSSPVTGPSPPGGVDGRWIPPGCTELAAVKLADTTPGVKVRPLVESRSWNATSEGELTRVGTFPEGGKVEVLGKDAVNLDDDRADISQRRPGGQQARERCAGD